MTFRPAADTASAPPDAARPEGFRRAVRALAEPGHAHAHAPVFPDRAARTASEAADALGVEVGQIAESIVFRRLHDDGAVLVVASGDRRVDEAKVAERVGEVDCADAASARAATSSFAIGGVAPVGRAGVEPPLALVDREPFRFDGLRAAGGRPHGVLRLTPRQLVAFTGAPAVGVAA